MCVPNVFRDTFRQTVELVKDSGCRIDSAASPPYRAALVCARIVCFRYKTLVVQTTDLALTHNDGSLLPSAECGTVEPDEPANDQRGMYVRTSAGETLV